MKADHLDVVQALHAQQPPVSGDLASCFAFEQRVLAELTRRFPRERWGYLSKGGENTLIVAREFIKVGRVCDPSGQLYKLLTDIPTTNAPIWSDDGNVAADNGQPPEVFYRAFDGGDPPPPPPPVTPDVAIALVNLTRSVQALQAQVMANESYAALRYGDLAAQIADLHTIAKAPQHFEGAIKIFAVPGTVTMDRK